MISNKVEFEIDKSKLSKALQVIETFVSKVQENEQGTRAYHAFQYTDKPTAFIHFMVFENEEAENLHKNSAWCRSFVDALYPMCTVEPVFTRLNYIM